MNFNSVLAVSADTDRALITQAELATHIGADGSTHPRLVSAVKAASDLVEAYCLTRFRQRTYVETFHDRPSVCPPFDVMLRRVPVANVDSVEDAAAAAVPATDFELIDPINGRLRFYSPDAFLIDSDRWRLVITYQAGFVDIPDDLRRATLEVAQRLYRHSGTAEGAVASESLGDWSVTYTQAFISGPTRGILDKYRRLQLA